MALAGCIGSEAGGSAPSADDVDDTTNTTEDVEDGVDNSTDVDPDDDSGNETEPARPRTPTDAMSGDPADTGYGMAHFVQEGSFQMSVFGEGADADTYTLENPGDLTFFDVYLHTPANDDATGTADLDLYLYNGTGNQSASAATIRTAEYLYHIPEPGVEQNFTLEVSPFLTRDTQETSYTLEVWAWTAQNWSVAEVPFVDVWEQSYEWGQVETPAFSIVFFPEDPTGVTDDGVVNGGGVSWDGCGNQGGSERFLPCPRDPYTAATVVIQDDVAGQDVGAFFTTCSEDGDIVCGETNNLNDTTDEPGPNELEAGFCGIIQNVQRDPTDPSDGTGPGLWDQRGEEYRDAEGNMTEHPGVDGISIFLRGPQRGGAELCSNADAYTGPTSGTVKLIATR